MATLAKAKAKTNETFIVQVSLMIVTYDHQNMFIVQATALAYFVFSSATKKKQVLLTPTSEREKEREEAESDLTKRRLENKLDRFCQISFTTWV